MAEVDKKEIVIDSESKVIALSEKYNIPAQVIVHFKDCDESELRALANVYSGSSESPNFTEWLEDYQKNSLFKESLEAGQKASFFEDKLHAATITLAEAEKSDDPKILSNARKSYNMWSSVVSGRKGYWLNVVNTLNKLVQEGLRREVPKKIDITRRDISFSDVSKKIRESTVIDAVVEDAKK